MEFVVILANTARSQAYIQTLIDHKLYPKKIFILDDENKKSLGKIDLSSRKDASYSFKSAIFNPKEDLISTLKKANLVKTSFPKPP